LQERPAYFQTTVYRVRRLNSEQAEQLKEFNAAIYSNSRQKTYHYCLIGRNLSVLKKGKKRKKFIEYVQSYLPAEQHSRCQIYFLMDLYDLATTYNRLMYVTLGIGIMKSKFRLVKQTVREDEAFWKM